jgi:hypothetical protein
MYTGEESKDFTSYPHITSAMRYCLKQWIERGICDDDFLEALITNNLKTAFLTADANSTQYMGEYVGFLWNIAPQECWGSEKEVDEWTASGGMRGL